jgi:hypothetical protein
MNNTSATNYSHSTTQSNSTQSNINSTQSNINDTQTANINNFSVEVIRKNNDLQYACEKLKNDREFVLSVVRNIANENELQEINSNPKAVQQVLAQIESKPGLMQSIPVNNRVNHAANNAFAKLQKILKMLV